MGEYQELSKTESQHVCGRRWWTAQHVRGYFAEKEGRKRGQGFGWDKIEENPSAYCLMML